MVGVGVEDEVGRVLTTSEMGWAILYVIQQMNKVSE